MAASAAFNLQASGLRGRADRYQSTTRAVRHGLTAVGIAYALIHLAAHAAGVHTDAYEYWSVPLDQIYLQFTEFGPGYAYPPPFALVVAPLTTLPYPAFYGLWVAVMAGIALWLVRPLTWTWRLPLLLLAVPELLTGNYHMILAAAIVLSFGRAEAIAVLLLTKITPGISLLWFAARREWRSVAIALSVTMAVVAIAYLLQPMLWGRWWDAILAHTGSTGPAAVGLPLAVRLPIAAAVMVFAARSDRRWLVPVAVLTAMPWIYLQSFVVLLAVVRLLPPGYLPLAAATPFRTLGRATALTPRADSD